MNHVKSGEIIFGVAWVTCINCIKDRAYYVYWKAGEGGWYAEQNPKQLELPKPIATAYSDMQINEYLDKLVPKISATTCKIHSAKAPVPLALYPPASPRSHGCTRVAPRTRPAAIVLWSGAPFDIRNTG